MRFYEWPLQYLLAYRPYRCHDCLWRGWFRRHTTESPIPATVDFKLVDEKRDPNLND